MGAIMDANENLPPTRAPSITQVPMRAAPNAPVPPHPLDKQWFAHIDGQTYGPYSGHDIKRMVGNQQILESDFLCPEGGNSWIQAKNDPLLGALFQNRTAPQSVPISGNTGTIVQVTNQMPNLAHAALLLAGPAAPKSPGVAALLSFLICGVGQMYNGQVAKGFLMLLGCIAAWFILLGWVIWIWAMVDAYHVAKAMNLRYQQRILAGLP
jgi:TM2 domain-containing membrane protein YozV